MVKKIIIILCLSLSFGAFAKTWMVQIEGMTCGNCVRSITAELKKYSAVSKIEISLEKKEGVITSDDAAQFGEPQIRQAISRAGYKVGSIK